MSIQQEVIAFKMLLVQERLAQCTPEQQARFNQIFSYAPNGVDEKNVDSAIGLLDRTLNVNMKAPK